MLSCFSRALHFATQWTVCSLLGFSVHEILQARINWNGLSFPSPGHLPNPGFESVSLMSPALSGRFFNTSTTWEAPSLYRICIIYALPGISK